MAARGRARDEGSALDGIAALQRTAGNDAVEAVAVGGVIDSLRRLEQLARRVVQLVVGVHPRRSAAHANR